MNAINNNILDIDKEKKLSLSVENIIGKRIALLGIPGSGKTNTSAVLIEELICYNISMTIVDIEGEYFGLKEKYEILVAGRSKNSEIPLFVENASAIAEMSIKNNISVILDLSEYDPEEMQEILFAYFQQLWKLSTLLKKPYGIILEEAHEFIPQNVRSPLKTLLTRFALRGRKRGIGIILSSQRSAKVEKDLLTQCDMFFLHKVVHPIDLNVYKDLIPLSPKIIDQEVRKLQPGEAYFVSGEQVDLVFMRIRYTFHAGTTPGFDLNQLQLKKIDASILDELRAITKKSLKEGGSDELSKINKKLKEYELKIIELENIVKKQKEQIDLISTLRVVNSDIPLIIERASISTLNTVTKPFIENSYETKFELLEKRLNNLPSLEVNILNLLVLMNSPLTLKQIAKWLGKSEASIQNNPPNGLLGLGIITRTKYGNVYHYRHNLDVYLVKEFPNADVEKLQLRLIRK